MDELEDLIAQHRIHIPGQRWRYGRILLFVSVFYERLAYFGLTSNLLIYLMSYPNTWTSYNSNTTSYLIEFTSSFFSVFGAWLADAYLGKFKVIVIGYFIYLLFYLPLPFVFLESWNGALPTHVQSFCDQHHNGTSVRWIPNAHCRDDLTEQDLLHESCVGVLLSCLSLVGLGSALIRSVITPFGAEQVQDDPTGRRTRSFFSWYYVSMNAGMIVAYLVLNYVQVNVSLFWGYMSACICLLVSFIIFLFCATLLNRTPPSGNIFCDICRVIVAGTLGRFCCCPSRGDQNLLTNEDENAEEVEPSVAPACLDHCKEDKGGRFKTDIVEDTKLLVRILTVFVPIVFYWTCFYQNRTYFLAQALHLKLPELFNVSVGYEESLEYYLPATWLEMIDSYSIFLLLPFLEYVVYPWLERNDINFSLYRRMGFGMILSTLAMLVAGIVERIRTNIFWGLNNTSPYYPEGSVNQTIVGTIYFASDMSVFWLAPQSILRGLGEAFTNVAGIELAFLVAPRRMQALITGCYWLTASIGSMLGMGLAAAVRDTLIFSDHCFDINFRKPCPSPHADQYCHETRLDVYFYLLASVQMMGFLLLIFITRFTKMGSFHTQLNVDESENSLGDF